MESFKTYLEDNKLAATTIKNHLRNLAKVKSEVLDGDEDTLAKYIKTNYDVGSQQKTITSSISKYRTFKELPREKIAELLKKTNNDATKIQQKNNDELELPDIKDVKSLMNLYYQQEMWKQYVVMFLLLHLQTRNLDLVAKITDKLEDVDNESNWLYIRKNDVVYFRNNYKTKAKYGLKKDIVKGKRFHNAVSQLTELLRPNENLYRSVMKITGQISETTMMKMSVCNNNNVKGIKKISKNRGTSMLEIATNYDCTK
tara:strand:- start:157 stop:927 length:771 start_codon:yes stop_codon:yes gene_type:complete